MKRRTLNNAFILSSLLQSGAASFDHTIVTQSVKHLLITMSTSHFQPTNKKPIWLEQVLMTGTTLTH